MNILEKIKSKFQKKDAATDGTKKPKEKKVEEKVRQTGSLKERLGRVKKTRWIRFGIVSLIFFAWVAWLGNWWVALFWFLLADIYLTQFIPWNWWKFSKSKVVRMVMSWVDAIVYALILVYFLFTFVGQNYQIPSSSLEKTLLTGDFLWVNKMVYGPRIPQTPLHFPLAQNEIFGIKSYIEHPQFKYHRLKGFRNVERGDIVVFNFPAGDTVIKNSSNPDYYTQAFIAGLEISHPSMSDFTNNPYVMHDSIMLLGRKAIRGSNKVIYRPVDRRDNYVKRCVGLPGEHVSVVNGVVYIEGKPIKEPKNVQYEYEVGHGSNIVDNTYLIDELEVTRDEKGNAYNRIRNDAIELPLTYEMKEKLEKCSWVTYIKRKVYSEEQINLERLTTYPLGYDFGWTHSNYGPIWIPKKGVKILLTPWNIKYYERCIRDYECVNLTVKDGKAYIDGKLAETYTFKMDYYWMMGDNRDDSLDSRFWGFVPEDHIVGTPMFVIISFDKDRGWFDGKIRWNRIFRDANPDK